MRRRFRDGNIYKFGVLRLPRRGVICPAGWGLTVRWCDGKGGRGVARSLEHRRRKLAREADKLIVVVNRVIAEQRYPDEVVIGFSGIQVRPGELGLHAADWRKMARTGRPMNRRRISMERARAFWLSHEHRKPAPGHRSDQFGSSP